MSKTFRAWKIDEPLFLPPMVGDFVANGQERYGSSKDAENAPRGYSAAAQDGEHERAVRRAGVRPRSLRLRKPAPACLTASSTFSRSVVDLASRTRRVTTSTSSGWSRLSTLASSMHRSASGEDSDRRLVQVLRAVAAHRRRGPIGPRGARCIAWGIQGSRRRWHPWIRSSERRDFQVEARARGSIL
jgi:hypothetical protein